jgi:hypothetical protein
MVKGICTPTPFCKRKKARLIFGKPTTIPKDKLFANPTRETNICGTARQIL